MENDQVMDPLETDTPHASRESNQATSEVKPEEPKREGPGDDESIDESGDTTGTRLVKFQLFETKAVRFRIPTDSDSSVSIS